MADIFSTGTVAGFVLLNVNASGPQSDIAKVTLKVGAKTETFIIWPGSWPSTSGDVRASSAQRLVWTTALALLRDALSQNLPVSILHDENGSIVKQVQIAGGSPI